MVAFVINSRILRTISLLLILVLFCPAASGKIIYVDDNAPGTKDGASWENAYVHLQKALADANDSEKPVEIRVAAGIYVPYFRDNEKEIREEDLEVSFRLINNVVLLGGYAGFEGQDPNTRDIDGNRTILSGNIGDYYNINQEPWDIPLKSYNVVSGSRVDANAVLDGFTIYDAQGTNMVNSYSHPTITNCVFIANFNHRGMSNRWSSPTITNCIFKQNTKDIKDISGGGIYNNESSPKLTNCVFEENHTWKNGGGMYNNDSNPILKNCTFLRNTTKENGGAMYNDNSSPTLIECTFEGNSAKPPNMGGWISRGGGIFNVSGGPNLVKCNFKNNHAQEEGGAVYCRGGSAILRNCTFENNGSSDGGGIYSFGSILDVTNCVFSENSATEGIGGAICNESRQLEIVSCMFSGNSAGTGGALYIDEDPVLLGGCDLTIKHSNFSGNSAGSGGGLYIPSSIFNLVEIENSIFSGNTANYGGGIRGISPKSFLLINCTFCKNISHHFKGGGGIYSQRFDYEIARMKNCIFRDSDIQVSNGIGITYEFCNIEGSDIEGIGNINVDPCFANPGYWAHADDPNIQVEPNDPNAIWIDGDYHLMSEFGRWDPGDSNWVYDNVTSPCIDAGDPTSQIGEEPMPHGGRLNIGAYGGTIEASLSPNDIPNYAYHPMPVDGAVDVDISTKLTWDTGFDAVSHDIYFGTTNPPTFIQNQTVAEYDPGLLKDGTEYYWRIDEVDSLGNKTIGDIWTFTTKPEITKGRSCFIGNTPVNINGVLIPISKVGFGRRIDGIDRISEIEEVQEHQGTYSCYDVILDSGNCISVADNHYFMAESGQWLSLHGLRAGIKLRTIKGSVEIVKIIKRPEPYTGKVYNIKVVGSDHYIVGKDGIIVRDY
jgi:predicted outer membrane repeat protein